MHEQREHLERLWRQRNTLAVPEELGGVGVELERSETNHFLGSIGLTQRLLMNRSCGTQCREIPDALTIRVAAGDGQSTPLTNPAAGDGHATQTRLPRPDFVAESIGGRRVSLTQLRGRPVLLKFYRFATCPICNLHMHRFIQEHRMVSDAGLTTVVLYHPPADKLAESQDYATPFDLVPDGEEDLPAYGVGAGCAASSADGHARVPEGAQGRLLARAPHERWRRHGQSRDFLIDASGRVVFAHYGKHYADSLEACDVVNAWRSVQHEARTPNAALSSRAKRGIALVLKEGSLPG
jgi:peroxiredoxin